jgi:ribose/xylose/arabinose/galactoside ABC-type transport system permease subunit
MSLGMVVEALDLSACMLASLLAVIVYIEIGSPYDWILWLVVSLTSFIILPGSVVWIEYLLVFGPYPILKAHIERLPRHFWIPVKLSFISVVLALLWLVVELLIGISFFGTEHAVLKILTIVIALAAFFAYDKLIELFARLYIGKYRKRFERFFK